MTVDTIPTSSPLKRSITLHRDGMYEVQALWAEPGTEAQLDAWIELRKIVEREHDGAALMVLEPLKALYGKYLPSVVRLVAWGTNEGFARLRRDPRAVELDAQLTHSFAESTITLMRMHPEIHSHPEEVDIQLDGRLCYELCTFWDRPDASRASWDAFIAAATPSIDAHGGHPLLVFQPVENVRGEFLPTRFCIAAWDSLEHFESFVSAPEQEEISRLRWLAVRRMDATGTRLR